MARRKSFTSLINQVARESGKLQRQAEAVQRKQTRETERSMRETARWKALSDKEGKQHYHEARQEEVDDKTREIAERIDTLKSVLGHTFSINDTIVFDDLRIHHEFALFNPAKELQIQESPPVKEKYFESIKAPNTLSQLIPGVKERYQKTVQQAEVSYQDAFQQFINRDENRKAMLQQAHEQYEKEKQNYLQEVERRNRSVTELETAYKSSDPEAIITYSTMVLERSEYPEGFPQEFRIAYIPEPKEIVIEYELPNVDVIPTVLEYRYIKTKDTIEEKPRKPVDTRELFQDIVASVSLRTIHEIFEADQFDYIQVVTFNGFVQSVDVSTGHDIRPCLISLRTSRDNFLTIDLRRVEKRACLRNLGAQVSPRPAEMQGVKPIIEFNMVDKRYIEQSDILSDLESRPNLMDLDPYEFENLVSNLFQRMGLETKLTQASKDGGVDAVAYDTRPILGGKVIIQAKRYKNVVGVSAVRDLYGTMLNEGANKGILVTTSHYGADAYEFSKDKPIELIDGGGLLYLLDQVGVKARIIIPDD